MKEALQEILRCTREGQFDLATEELVKTFQDAVYGYCFNRLHEQGLAEDVAQEVFLAAWRGLPKARFAHGEASIAPWVYAIAKYKIMDECRISPEIPVEDPPEGLEPEISKLDLERAWMKLDPKEREVLLWCAQGFWAREIAEFLEEDITKQGVRLRIFRARRKLKELLGNG